MDRHELFRSIVVLNALFASLAWCLARTNRASMLSVVIFAALWPFVDKPLGGRTIYVISPGQGITTGDFLSLVAIVIVAVLAGQQKARVREKNKRAVTLEELEVSDHLEPSPEKVNWSDPGASPPF